MFSRISRKSSLSSLILAKRSVRPSVTVRYWNGGVVAGGANEVEASGVIIGGGAVDGEDKNAVSWVTC